MKRSLRLFAIFFMIFAACLIFCSCENEPTQTEETTVPLRTEGTKAMEYFEIETSYGMLKFPEQWKNNLTLQRVTTDTGEEIIFRETFTKESLTLFTVCIGETSNGSYIGSMTDLNGQKHEVYLRIDELEFKEELSTEMKSRIYAMQESVNYLIDNLK